MKAIIISIVVFFLLSTANSTSQNTISGIIYYADEPVKNAKIVFEPDGDMLKSDVNGYFSFETDKLKVTSTAIYKGLKQSVIFTETERFHNIIFIPSERKLYKLIRKSATVEKCDMFLANYPQSLHVTEVKKKLEELMFIQAYDAAVRDYNTLLLEEYLSDHPEGKYAEKARKNIEIISWQKARIENTIESYQEYLTKFPNGTAAEFAKDKITELNP